MCFFLPLSFDKRVFGNRRNFLRFMGLVHEYDLWFAGVRTTTV